MEVGRLKSVLDSVALDNQEHSLSELLTALEAAYAQSVKSPTPQTAQNFDAALEAVKKAALQSHCAALSAGRMRVLAQVGGTDLCGPGLMVKIRSILAAPSSPADVVRQLQDLRQRAQQFTEATTALTTALDRLRLAADEPPQGEAEVEVAIPTKLVDGGLAGFAKEAKNLDGALSNIIEAATGSRPPLRISGLGTGSVELYVTVDPVSGAAILSLVTAVINLINSTLLTRRTRQELEAQSAPKTVIDGIRQWEGNRIDDALKQITEDLAKRSPLDKQRKTELRKVLVDSIHYLADRIDRGMDIDVTTTPPNVPQPEEGKPSAPTDPAVQASLSISEAAGTLARLERSPEPVLLLPPAKADDDQPKEPSKPK